MAAQGRAAALPGAGDVVSELIHEADTPFFHEAAIRRGYASMPLPKRQGAKAGDTWSAPVWLGCACRYDGE